MDDSSHGDLPMGLPHFRWPYWRSKPPPRPLKADEREIENEEGVAGSRRVDRKKLPRLDRTNAVKHIDYDAVREWDAESSSSASVRARSIDLLSFYDDKMSFRIGGEIEGEVECLCRSFGLSGPDDFAIPLEVWKARKVGSASEISPREQISAGNEISPSFSSVVSAERHEEKEREKETEENIWSACIVTDKEKLEYAEIAPFVTNLFAPKVCEDDENARNPTSFTNLVTNEVFGGERGIKGPRPSLLTPPYRAHTPSIPFHGPAETSTGWDLLMSLDPQDKSGRDSFSALEQSLGRSSGSQCNGRSREEDGRAEDGECTEVRLGVTGSGDSTTSSSFTATSNDDDASSTTTEGLYVISPNERFRRPIGTWNKGLLLGRGSYGTVYEAISDNGGFFAVKEVPLLNQGNDAQQCIEQLEREIVFLSEFKHENIVQYLGTEKGEATLYIFLELVTQGSLASLYHTYCLQDSHVSAYTGQILNGLKYLHNRNVVHRDIKCANILVDANGYVKLADFGLAKETTKFSMLKSCKGSVYWMAPEVIDPKKSYGSAADIWSLGCTVLEMLTKKPPYSNLEQAQAIYQIGHGLMPDIPDTLSREAKDFICQCLQVNPDDRPTASKLLDHPFVRRQISSPWSHGLDSSSHGRRV